MIQIVYTSEYQISSVAIEITANTADYAGAYARILEALHGNQEIRLVVQHQTVFQWLKNLAARYPQGTFTFETLDARQALAQKWGVPIPTEVRNEEVQTSGLLALDLHAGPGQDFNDLLLAHFYSPLLTAKTFPFTQLPQLFQASGAWQTHRADSLLARTLRQRLEAWQSRARSTEQRQFIAWFAEDPRALKTLLLQFRVLRSYPALAEALLGEKYAILLALKLPLDDLVVDAARIPAVVNQVAYYLNAYPIESAANLEALLVQVSGLLQVEYDTFERALLAHPDWLSHTLVERLESTFTALGRRLYGSLAKLRAQIRPPKPQSPAGDLSVEQMLAWAVEIYLPYQAWCSAQERFDKDLYTLGDAFSAWLMAHWDDIRANSGRMVFNILPALATELNAPGRVHLMLVVDNLGWTYGEMLRDLFQARGFYLIGTELYLAMLPTETEISKKCLLSGRVGYTAIDESSYKGILEKGWVPYFNDNAFRYLSDVGKLNQVQTLDARVYVVNYLEVDRALHKSADEIGVPHREHIQHLLARLVENVATFVEKHALGDRIRIHIVSDHGATQIPADAQNDLDPAYFKGSGFTARSHRYVEVSDGRFAALADNLKLDCFFLPAHEFMLPTNVLCARSANRFLSTDKDSFVHGGLLPEEVIVPYLAFEPAMVPLQPLDVLLKKNVFRYRLETVELDIGNPNAAAVEQVQVSVLNGNVEWECAPIPLLNGKRSLTLQATARFKLTALSEEQTALSLRLRYRARGETHTMDVRLPIEMRKIVEERHAGIFDD